MEYTIRNTQYAILVIALLLLISGCVSSSVANTQQPTETVVALPTHHPSDTQVVLPTTVVMPPTLLPTTTHGVVSPTPSRTQIVLSPTFSPTIPPSSTATVAVKPTVGHMHVPSDILNLAASPYYATLSLNEVSLVSPLQPITITVEVDDYRGPLEIRFFDSHLQPSGIITTEVTESRTQVMFLPRGRLGPQCAVALIDGQVAGINSNIFTLDAYTNIHTGQFDLDMLYPTVRGFMAHDVVSYMLDGIPVRGYRSPDNPLLWLRDHVYQGQAFRYFEPDVTSLLNAFRRAQYPDGSFPDVLSYPELQIDAHRLEPESDLEYLFVLGIYDAWQATGDDAWLRDNLDSMYRGIAYLTSNPQRWNSALGLVQRPYTIDTWDFQYGPTTTSPDGKPSPRHWIDSQTIWGIFHGDNTGLASALKHLERIEGYLGNIEQSYRVRNQRNGLMERLNRLSWRGPFYTHFVLPDGSVPHIAGVATADQLSLSNALALNRDILAFEQGRDIIESYHKRRNFERAFAEWYSIDPPFPAGSFGMGGKKGEQPGEYVNGGIMPLVGGELARGAFTFGSEAYGFDILKRYAELIKLTGATYLWYYPDGRPGISGNETLSTDGWGASAMLNALIEGAAGVVDKSSRYRELELSPRWGTLPEMRHAHVVVRYAASDGYVAYTWEYEPTAQTVRLELTGSWEHAKIRLLLPPDGQNTRSRTLLVNGQSIPVEKKKIGSGQYIVFNVDGGYAKVELTWVK